MRFGRALGEELFVRRSYFDAQEHSSSSCFRVEALSLFIPVVFTCTSSQKVLYPQRNSLRGQWIFCASKCFQKNDKAAKITKGKKKKFDQDVTNLIKNARSWPTFHFLHNWDLLWHNVDLEKWQSNSSRLSIHISYRPAGYHNVFDNLTLYHI